MYLSWKLNNNSNHIMLLKFGLSMYIKHINKHMLTYFMKRNITKAFPVSPKSIIMK